MKSAQLSFLALAKERAESRDVSVVTLPPFNMDAVGLRLEKGGRTVDVAVSGVECYRAKSLVALAECRVDAALAELGVRGG